MLNTNRALQKNCTPLHVAARYNHTEVCRFLMSQGADMSMKDSVRCSDGRALTRSCSCTPLGHHMDTILQLSSNVAGLLQAGRTPSQVTKAPDTKVRLTARQRGRFFSQKPNNGTAQLLLECKYQ